MSKIDDTQAAITAIRDKLGEISTDVQAAVQEAEETQNALASIGAEANAEHLGQAKESLEQALQGLAVVGASLDDAFGQAEAGKG